MGLSSILDLSEPTSSWALSCLPCQFLLILTKVIHLGGIVNKPKMFMLVKLMWDYNGILEDKGVRWCDGLLLKKVIGGKRIVESDLNTGYRCLYNNDTWERSL